MLFAGSIFVVYDWCFMRWRHLLKLHLMPLRLIAWPILMQNGFHAFFPESWYRKTLNRCTEFCQRVFAATWKLANNDVFFFNFALRYHKDIDHWVIYHLKDVCEMCRRSLNHFSWINIIPCGVVVHPRDSSSGRASASCEVGQDGCRIDTWPRHTKDVIKMVPVATLLGAQHYKASTGFSSLTNHASLTSHWC